MEKILVLMMDTVGGLGAFQKERLMNMVLALCTGSVGP
jgi:hypothetical protein